MRMPPPPDMRNLGLVGSTMSLPVGRNTNRLIRACRQGSRCMLIHSLSSRIASSPSSSTIVLQCTPSSAARQGISVARGRQRSPASRITKGFFPQVIS